VRNRPIHCSPMSSHYHRAEDLKPGEEIDEEAECAGGAKNRTMGTTAGTTRKGHVEGSGKGQKGSKTGARTYKRNGIEALAPPIRPSHHPTIVWNRNSSKRQRETVVYVNRFVGGSFVVLPSKHRDWVAYLTSVKCVCVLDKCGQVVMWREGPSSAPLGSACLSCRLLRKRRQGNEGIMIELRGTSSVMRR